MEFAPQGGHGVGCTVKLRLCVWEDTLRGSSGAVLGNGGGKRKIGDLSSHLLLVGLVSLILFLRGALQRHALLLHTLARQHVLRPKCSFLRGEAGGDGGHGFSMPRLPLLLKFGNEVLDLGLGLDTVVRGLGPELGELSGVSTLRVGLMSLGLAGILGELGAGVQHRGLRALNGGLCGRLGGANSRLQSRALGLLSHALGPHGSDFGSQG